MSDNFQEIDGVGPSREEDLTDAGYESYSDLGEADAATLEEDIPRLSGDTALEIIVQAQNLAGLDEAEPEANPEVEEPQPEPEPEPELNGLHSSVMQHRLYYQGRNLREQLEALRRIENKINGIREENLF